MSPVIGRTRVAELSYGGDVDYGAPPLLIGPRDVLVDGEPFPWETVGPWTVTIKDDDIAVLTLSIAVTLPKRRDER